MQSVKIISIVITSFILFPIKNALGQAGNLDYSFGINGKTITDFANSADVSYSIAIQPDGKIVLAGTTGNDSSDFAIARFNENGNLDSTFNKNGKVTTDLGSPYDACRSVAIQKDGKIIATGSAGTGTLFDFATVRYNKDGSLDSSFNASGMVRTSFPGGSYSNSYSVAEQPDGKILVGGYVITDFSAPPSFALVRYNMNGLVDSSFGVEGKVITSQGTEAFSLAIQSDGKILLSGYFYDKGKYDFAVARFNSNGILDSSFNLTGIVITAVNSGYDISNCMTIQPDGKIILAGFADSSVALVRYNTKGILDSTFGTNGKILISTSGSIYSIALQRDGKIILGGTSDITPVNFTLIRCDSNGMIDSTFGLNGIVSTDSGIGTSVAVQQDGKILLGGYTLYGQAADFALNRYLSGLELGIVDFSKQSNFISIFPNPIHENEILKYTLIHDEIISISLYNIKGEIVQSFFTNKKRKVGDNRDILNFNRSLPSGNYILSISNGKNQMSIKVVKL